MSTTVQKIYSHLLAQFFGYWIKSLSSEKYINHSSKISTENNFVYNPTVLDIEALIKTGGYIGITAIVFAESGLLAGFFLPGDSLLFTAGFLASQGYMNIWVLLILTIVAAITGDSTGYFIGKKIGPKIFKKEDSFFFHKDHIEKARTFFEKHGGKSIILARFIPIIRTFTPTLAGVGQMEYRKFLIYNIAGGLLWTCSLIGAGNLLGRTVPDAEKYVFPIILIIIVLSILPTIIHVTIEKKKHKKQESQQKQ